MKSSAPLKKGKKIGFGSASVEEVFGDYPAAIREKLLYLRELILETADELGVGPLEETLKWGEPSYLTTQSKSGSTVRIHHKTAMGDNYGMYFICQTDLVSRFRKKYSKSFQFEGNRCILFQMKDKIPVTELKDCIAMALTYHKA